MGHETIEKITAYRSHDNGDVRNLDRELHAKKAAVLNRREIRNISAVDSRNFNGIRELIESMNTGMNTNRDM